MASPMISVPEAPRARRIQVIVNDAEFEAIEAQARRAGLSVSAFLRAAGLGVTDGVDGDALQAEIRRAMGRITVRLDALLAEMDAAEARMAALDARRGPS